LLVATTATSQMPALQKFLGAASPDKVLPLCGVHLNIVSYAFCYWLTRPVEPFLLAQTAQAFGLLQSWFSFLMLLGGPFIGRVCDAKGAHIGLMVCQLGAALGYGFTGLARNLPMLFLARVPQVFMHVMQASQAVVVRCTDDQARGAAMGKLSLSYRVGMVLGSTLGGTLALRVGNAGVMLAAAGVSALSLPITYACVPASSVAAVADMPAALDTGAELEEGAKADSEKGNDGGLNLGRIVEVMRTPAVRRLITMDVALSLGQVR
jgi:MFS family permease